MNFPTFGDMWIAATCAVKFHLLYVNMYVDSYAKCRFARPQSTDVNIQHSVLLDLEQNLLKQSDFVSHVIFVQVLVRLFSLEID